MVGVILRIAHYLFDDLLKRDYMWMALFGGVTTSNVRVMSEGGGKLKRLRMLMMSDDTNTAAAS